jgi:hypothetical protein
MSIVQATDPLSSLYVKLKVLGFLLVEWLVTAGTVEAIAWDAAELPVATMKAAMLNAKGFDASISLLSRGMLIQHLSLREKTRPTMFPGAIPQSSLCAGFLSGTLPQGLEFRKIFLCDPPLNERNAVDMA